MEFKNQKSQKSARKGDERCPGGHLYFRLDIILVKREKGGWRWIAERPVASDKVPEGGHLTIFSPFLSLSFCFKDRRPSRGRSG